MLSVALYNPLYYRCSSNDKYFFDGPLSMTQAHIAYLRQLPAVDEVLRDAETQPWVADFPRTTITTAVREVLETARQTIIHSRELT